MCTLILAHRHFEGTALVVAANRDESLARPAAPPRLWTDQPVTLIAPEDLQAGGTWMGLNERGLFAGVTNRFAPGPDPGALSRDRRSRGLLVLDALAYETAGDAARGLAQLPGEQHNPFHLALADRDEAHLVWSDGHRVVHEQLEPGLHVITERSRGAAPSQRVEELESLQPDLSELQGLLCEHREPTFEGTCVHWHERGYGTRSSALLTLATGGQVTLRFTEGPPCSSPWQDSSDLLAQLGF